jgi:hypothetical protein
MAPFASILLWIIAAATPTIGVTGQDSTIGNAPDVISLEDALNNPNFANLPGLATYNLTAPEINSTDEQTWPSFGDEAPAAFSRRAAKDFYLRIMPLGASITYGYASSDGNGYRKHLRDQLRYAGWKVNMVGSQVGGNMNDNVSVPTGPITIAYDRI